TPVKPCPALTRRLLLFFLCGAGLVLSLSTFALDVSFLGIGKIQSFVQTNLDTVVLASNEPFAFRAFVGLYPDGKLLFATLQPRIRDARSRQPRHALQ